MMPDLDITADRLPDLTRSKKDVLMALRPLEYTHKWKEDARCGFCAARIDSSRIRFRLVDIQKHLEICIDCSQRFLIGSKWRQRRRILYGNGAVEIQIGPIFEETERAEFEEAERTE